MTTENTQTGESHDQFGASIDAFVDSLVEGTEGESSSGLESFEQRVQKVRSEMHESMEEFRDTFLQGYELILEELSIQYAGGGHPDAYKPPPNAIKI